MLPECRTADTTFTIPTFDVTPQEVDGLLDELWDFQAVFHDCFARSESRAHFFDYMAGQLSPLARKSISQGRRPFQASWPPGLHYAPAPCRERLMSNMCRL